MTAADAPAVDAEASEGGRLQFVQGLRGVAVVLVVIYHAGLPLHAGFIGVDIFFVISGFVITRLLVREVREHGRIRFGRFYRRRVRRLLPALALMTAVTVVLSGFLQSPVLAQPDTGMVALGASAWMANVAIWLQTAGYFGATPSTIPLLHTWSLAVEEQFYLVFPFVTAIGAVVGRSIWRRRTRGIMVVLWLVLVVSFGLSLLLTYYLPDISAAQGLAYLSAPTRAWEFAVGAIVAVRALQRRPLKRHTASIVGAAGLVLMVGSAVALQTPLPFPGWGAVPPVLGTAMCLAACRVEGTWTRRALEVRWLRHLGDISYSWYLWHWPLITFAALLFDKSLIATVAAAAVSYPIGLLSYTKVEQPIRRRQPTTRFATLRLIGVSMAVPIVLALALLTGAAGSWGQSDIEDMADQLEAHNESVEVSCMSFTHISERDLDDCTVEGDSSEPPIILIGDSNSFQFAESVVAAGRELDRTVIVTAVGGCPLADVEVHQRGASWVACRDWLEDAMEWLADEPDATLVVASATRFVDQDHYTLSDPETGAESDEREGKAEIWETGLVRTYEALQADGHRILQITTIPHLYFGDIDDFVPWDPRQCNMPELLQDVTDCGVTTPRDEVDAYQAFALSSERSAAQETDVDQLNLRDEICDRTRCSTNDGTVRNYIDGLHISIGTALRLAPRFTEAIEAVG